jgi:hypothetical protein
MVLKSLFAAALFVRRRYSVVVHRPMPAAPGGRGVQAIARGAARCALHAHGRGAKTTKTDACGRSFAVLSTKVSPAGLHLRLVVPRPMSAAAASRCCRRKFQQLACACGTAR